MEGQLRLFIGGTPEKQYFDYKPWQELQAPERMEQPHTLEELFGYKVDETAFMRELKPYLETAQVSLTAHANACYYQWKGYIDEAKSQLTCKSGEAPCSLILSHNLLREAMNLDSPPVLARMLAYWNYELNAHLSPIIIDKLTSPDS